MKLRNLLAGVATVAALGLAAHAFAQEDDATAAAERDAKEATQMATPSPSEMNAGSIDQSSQTSGSSHTESSSSSTDFSVSVGVAPHALAGTPPSWRQGPNPGSGMALNGSWRLATASGDRSCTLRLMDGDDSEGPHYATTATGGPDGSLDVSRWRYDGRTLVLTRIMGEPFAQFHRVGRNRFEGRNVKSGEPLIVTR